MAMTRRKWLAAAAAAGAIVFGSLVLFDQWSGPALEPGLREAMAAYERIGLVTDAGTARSARGRLSFVAPSSGLGRALRAADPERVVDRMLRAGVQALLVDRRAHGRPGSILRRMVALAPLPRLAATCIGERWVLYVPHARDVPDVRLAEPIGRLARALLSNRAAAEPLGAAVTASGVPREVAIVLRGQGPALIWRSARRTSFAQSIPDAAGALAGRWHARLERDHGPLPQAMERLTVELEFFGDEGTIATRDEETFEAAFEPGIFGALMRRRGVYTYVLPTFATLQNRRPVLAMLDQLGRDATGYRTALSRSEVDLERFSTAQFRETRPGGPWIALDRGFPRVTEADVTPDRIRATLDLLAHARPAAAPGGGADLRVVLAAQVAAGDALHPDEAGAMGEPTIEGLAPLVGALDRATDAERPAVARALRLAARFVLQQVVVPGAGDYYIADPRREAGRVRTRVGRTETTDAAASVARAILQDALRAATP